jgi:hypothetical protein
MALDWDWINKENDASDSVASPLSLCADVRTALLLPMVLPIAHTRRRLKHDETRSSSRAEKSADSSVGCRLGDSGPV